MEDVSSFVAEIGERLGEVANSDLVVGQELKLGEVTIVPLSEIGVGFGGGGGSGEDGNKKTKLRNRGHGGGTGGGGGITPIAVAVFRQGTVEIMKIPTKVSPVAKLLERIPDLIDKIKDKD
jgi:uncharacterized spore protein YtfJ